MAPPNATPFLPMCSQHTLFATLLLHGSLRLIYPRFVMAGRVPAIHVDPRVKPGDDEMKWRSDTALPRIDLDDAQRRVFMCATAGARTGRMDFDREAPGCVGREAEFGDAIPGKALFDVVAVQMQGQGPIAGPPQFYTVALVDADQLHR